MKQRIITGVILGLLFLAVVFASGTIVYPLALWVLNIIGCYEMLNCVGVWKNPYLAVPAMLYAVGCPIVAYYFRYGMFFAATLVFLFTLLLLLVLASEKVHTGDVSAAFTMIVYVTVCFSSLIRVRYVTPEPGSNAGDSFGNMIYLLVFVAAWVTDTFAYFTGVFLGKHKLCPKISPKKTVEGAIGGTVFCVVAFLIYGAVVARIFKDNPTFAVRPNYIGLAVIGLVMSVLSQCGDLLASVIKRTYGVKDYGKIFPGHGGVLDRFDSVLLLAPFLLVLVEDGQFLQLLFHV